MREQLPDSLATWAERVEEAYIADALGKPAPAPLAVPPTLAHEVAEAVAAAAACAVAARYLSVGKPRSLAVLSDDPARAEVLLLGHRVWHQPLDVRWAGKITADTDLLARRGGRAVTVAEALTADLVCVDLDLILEPEAVRRGSHLALIRATASPALAARAVCVAEALVAPAQVTIGELAAGLRDGRQLDEITLLLAHVPHGLALARRALALT